MQTNRADEAYGENEEALRAEGERIEHLLQELSNSVAPDIWPRVSELMQRTVDLYGAGLGRLLSHAQAARDANELAERICADELLSSLLLIHGLHPETTEARVRRALERIQPRMGRHTLHFVSVGQGVLDLKTVTRCDGCGVSHANVERFVRMALQEAAPEVAQIHIEGLAQDTSGSGLVSLHVPARVGVTP